MKMTSTTPTATIRSTSRMRPEKWRTHLENDASTSTMIAQQTSLFTDANETRKERATFRTHCSARPQVTVNTGQYGEGYLN